MISLYLTLTLVFVFTARSLFASIGLGTDVLMSRRFKLSSKDFFSFTGILNFATGLCLSWTVFGLNSWRTAIIAVIIGFIAAVLLALAYRACINFEGLSVAESSNSFLYRIGNIRKTADGIIILQMPADDRVDEIIAFPDDGYSLADFDSGELAFVSKIETPAETSVRFYAKPYHSDDA